MNSKTIKRTLAGLSALTMAVSMTACAGGNSQGSEGGTTAAQTAETTAPATVAINTATLSQEEEAAVDSASSMLRDVELEDKEIKWLCP